MKIKFNENGTIRIDDVRLSYPHLFTPWNGEEGKPKKYSGKFIMPNETHKKETEALRAHLLKLQQEYFKARVPAANLGFRNGEDLNKPEFEDAWYVSASESLRPQVMGRNKEALTEEDDVVYAGCYVNVLVRPWKQDNNHGKKINFNLIGVQFKRDGERFGAERPDASEEFDDEDGSASGGDGFG